MTAEEKMIATLGRIERISEEFRRETDRGCAVLVLCLLEVQLREMISAVLPDPHANLGRLAPPGGMATTIQTAELLGLLSKRQARSFKMLADVRNQFAHGVLENLTFDSPQIANLLKSTPPAIPYDPSLARNLSNRAAFMSEVGSLLTLMVIKTPHIERLPRAVDFDGITGTASIPGLRKGKK